MRELSIVLLVFVAIFGLVKSQSTATFQNTITFYGQNSKGVKFFHRGAPVAGSLTRACGGNKGKFSIIVHGWRESCADKNFVTLVSNLAKYRGGCILCMDYSQYAQNFYSMLLTQFPGILSVLVGKLQQFTREGFAPANGFMFGFSYGAHLVLHGGLRAFKGPQFGLIDACDPAGIGFGGSTLKNASRAALNVQCIHTSSLLGTTQYTCDQDWKMGFCGASQPAETFSMTSHQLCPVFYNLAFTHSFAPQLKPWHCIRKDRAVTSWPLGYRMGYNGNRMSTAQVYGSIFSRTTGTYPYNK